MWMLFLARVRVAPSLAVAMGSCGALYLAEVSAQVGA